MASITRSTRRAEGHSPPHLAHANGPPTRSTAPPPGQALVQRQNDARSKRALEASERDLDTNKHKRTRIAVEILAKPQTQVLPPVHHPIQTETIPAKGGDALKNPKPATAPVPQHPTKQPNQDPNLSKHQAKVHNGIKAELDRLQPQAQPKDTKEQGRKLRSQEATRFKSELSAYFPDYDEAIGNDPKEQHNLNPETPIVVIDSNPRRAVPELTRGTSKPPYYPYSHNTHFPVRGYGDVLFTDVIECQRIDFGFLEAQHKNKNIDDPLPDRLFEPIHKRAERLERSIRNSEKGRAQHEKDQIIRLLEGLQGHDWLRVMGVSGITETKKKQFEPAREHFIRGCQAILDKFKNWSLEEKRRKLEKERALAEAQEAVGQSEQAEEDSHDEQHEQHDGAEREEQQAVKEESQGPDDESERVATSQDDTSESTSPARQLRQEALARSNFAASLKRQRSTARPTPPPKLPDPPKEFTSFFSKKYERDGALNRHRRVGRKVLAWGHPIPDIPDADFELPAEYRDIDTLKSRERRKRRDRRGSRGPK